MSIFIENIKWSQTDNEIILLIPIHGKKVTDNVIITEKFMKVNCSPYYYELFFEKLICAEESSCKILESCIKCILKKSIKNEWWTELGKPAKMNGKINEKCILNELRKKTRAEYEEKMQANVIEKRNEQAQLKRDIMDKSIDRQQLIRKKIADVEQDLKEVHLKNHNVDESKMICSKKPTIKLLPKNVEPILPPIRTAGTININLTARRFITPKRESQDQAEREWCAKQHEIMTKTIGFCDDNLNADERDPQWLLQKGYNFLEKKNFLAAVSAFSSGLKIVNESPNLFLGRAKAQFHLRNFKRCVSFSSFQLNWSCVIILFQAEDCSDALEKFTPATSSNLKDRINCIWLRGKSLIQLGFIEHGCKELQAALTLDPTNIDLKKDFHQIKQQITIN